MWPFNKKPVKSRWRNIKLGERLEIGDRFLLDDNKTHAFLGEENLQFGEGPRIMSNLHKPHQRWDFE